MQLKEMMQAGLDNSSSYSASEQAIMWVPKMWAALESGQECLFDNELVNQIIDTLRELVDMLVSSSVGDTLNARAAYRLGAGQQ